MWLISYNLLPTLLIVPKQTMLRWLQHVICSCHFLIIPNSSHLHSKTSLSNASSNSHGTSYSLQATSKIPRSQTISCSNRNSELISGVKKSNLHCRTDHIPGQISTISQGNVYRGCTQHWPYYLVECSKTKWSEFGFCGLPATISSIICINGMNLLKLWSDW